MLTSLIRLGRIFFGIVYKWRVSLCRVEKNMFKYFGCNIICTFQDPDLPAYLVCQDPQCQILRVGTQKDLHFDSTLLIHVLFSDDFMWFHKFWDLRFWEHCP